MPQNEPGLSSALRTIERLVQTLQQQQIPADRIALMGFSQGACLTLEFAARHAQRYAVIAGFSGGVIGPPGTPRDYSGTFDGTPVFLGCSDVDQHIPVERVHESADVFARMGARVDKRIYPGMAHTIIAAEIEAVDALLTVRDSNADRRRAVRTSVSAKCARDCAAVTQLERPDAETIGGQSCCDAFREFEPLYTPGGFRATTSNGR